MAASAPRGPGAVPDRPWLPLFTAAVVRLSLAELVYFTATGVAVYALPLYVTGPMGSTEAGAGLAFAVTALVLRPFAGRLSDSRGRALMGLGVAFSTPAFFSAIFATASPSQRGAASGTASAMLDIGLGGGPIILGLVAQSLGIPWAFGVGAAIALAGCSWAFALARRPVNT
jgi:predicted MFS family arabinose efflux permease